MPVDLLTVGPSFWADMRKNNGSDLDATDEDIMNGGPDHVADLLKAAPPAPALAISGTPVLTGTEDAAYDGFTVTAENGATPYVYSLVGTWPAGITINASSGAVSGTPAEAGTFEDLSVRVTDDDSATADLEPFTLEIGAA